MGHLVISSSPGLITGSSRDTEPRTTGYERVCVCEWVNGSASAVHA